MAEKDATLKKAFSLDVMSEEGVTSGNPLDLQYVKTIYQIPRVKVLRVSVREKTHYSISTKRYWKL